MTISRNDTVSIVAGSGDTVTEVLESYDAEFDALISAANTDIAVNTAKVTNATHTGDVTGDEALTIAADAVTYAKMQNVADDERVLGRVSGAGGVVEELTKAQVLTMLNVADGADMLASTYDPTSIAADAFARANHSGTQATSTVTIPNLNSPSALTQEDWANLICASNHYGGGAFTDNADGTMTVAAGTGFVRAANTAGAQLLSFSWAENASLALTDDNTNYVYVSYHATTPTVNASTTKPTDSRTNVLLGKVYRDGTHLHLFKAGMNSAEFLANLIGRLTQVAGEITHASGGVISETGTRNLASTAAVVWGGLSRVTTSSQDTSGADTFHYFYYTGAAWTDSDQSQIDNTQYNNIAVGLATLSNNQYGIHWVYLDPDGHILVVYGQDSYTLGEAQEAQPPADLPSHVSQFCWLAAKVIIAKNGISFTEIQSAYDTSFSKSVASIHNDLAGLNDGDYVHLTATEKTLFDTVESGADVTDAANVASTIHGATAKTIPVDADEVGLIDSAASNVLKKLTWTNIKATLKTYFDTLYMSLTSPKWGGDVDVNGYSLGDGTLELLSFSETASAVNEITIKNAATGDGPEIQATGSDTNIDLILKPKGTGAIDGSGNAQFNTVLKINSIGSTSSNITCDCEAYNLFVFEPTGDLDVAFTNLVDGGIVAIRMTGGGDHTITWKVGTAVTNFKFDEGVEPDWSTTTGIDTATVQGDGTDSCIAFLSSLAVAAL